MPGKPEAQVTRSVEVSQAWTSVYCVLKGKDRAFQVVWMKETQVQSLGQEDPLEEGIAIHSSFWPGESHEQRNLAGYSPWGCKVRHD